MAVVNDSAVVDKVRSFNRFYTKLLGLLSDKLNNTNFSLIQSRVLYEIYYANTVYASTLVKELSVDAAYLSRIIKKFEKEGLISRRIDDKDSRKHSLIMTEKGKNVFIDIQNNSNHQIKLLLGEIKESEKQSLSASMDKIMEIFGEKNDQSFTFRTHKPGDIGYLAYMHSRFYSKEYGFDITFDSYVAGAMVKFIENYDEEKECLWVVEKDEKILGSIAIVKAEDSGVAQLRWFILEPEAHGMGVGKKLIYDAVEFCRQKKYEEIVLWTFSDLVAARALYSKHNFEITKVVKHHIWGQNIEEECWTLNLKS